MELELYRCAHCGNVVFKAVDKGTPISCCGEVMQKLIPGTTDAALEKHVPVVEKHEVEGGYFVDVKVGSVAHPMLPEHYLPIIAAVSGDTVTIRLPKPGDEPVLHTFCADGDVTGYELCNLHGYWKSVE